MSIEAIFDQLDPVITKWTMGGQASGAVPPAWEAALGAAQGENRELSLLALTGHYLDFCVRVAPAIQPSALPDLPILALPLIPEAHRALARRCLKNLKDQESRRNLVQLVAARGFVLHPADWMPTANEDSAPDVYAPWRDWVAMQNAQVGKSIRTYEVLTPENWDDWWPAARRNALKAMRSHDPAGARALLEAKVVGEIADVRFRLIECLSVGLSAQDIAYLESLQTDRAPTIKALADYYLSRLGAQTGSQADNVELATYFKIETKGIFRKTTHLVANALKASAQMGTRNALFEKSDMAGFARALGLSPNELVAIWPVGTVLDFDLNFARMCERSAPDMVIQALCERLLQAAPMPIQMISALQSRLSAEFGQEFATRILLDEAGSFSAAYEIGGHDLDCRKAIQTQMGHKRLAACFGQTDTNSEAKSFAFLASQQSAVMALAIITQTGATGDSIMMSDPRLDFLRLNAALMPTGVTS